jgi:3D (Asp-Asp-Asp) domain-containing protein
MNQNNQVSQSDDDKCPLKVRRGKRLKRIVLLFLIGLIGVCNASIMAQNGSQGVQYHQDEFILIDQFKTPIETNLSPIRETIILNNDYTLLSNNNNSDLMGDYYEVMGEVSGYTSSVEETDSTPFITASGTTTHKGTLANNCLPFGTQVEIFGQVYVVEDRMNSRYGCNVFDIWVKTKVEAYKLGRKTNIIKVYYE